MQKPPFHETLDQLVARDPRFSKEAYGFLREALEFTQKKRRKSRAESTHVSANELLEGFREYSLQQFGPMGLTVLEYWGVRSTGDVGRMVFNLIEAGVFGRADDDGFSFEEAFLAPFRPVDQKKTRRAPRSRKVAQETN